MPLLLACTVWAGTKPLPCRFVPPATATALCVADPASSASCRWVHFTAAVANAGPWVLAGIDNTVSFADLVGRQDPLGEDGSARCKLPIEVKGEWQECHEGKHFADLLCGTEKERERVLDVCAQTLGHTVRLHAKS